MLKSSERSRKHKQENYANLLGGWLLFALCCCGGHLHFFFLKIILTKDITYDKNILKFYLVF